MSYNDINKQLTVQSRVLHDSCESSGGSPTLNQQDCYRLFFSRSLMIKSELYFSLSAKKMIAIHK